MTRNGQTRMNQSDRKYRPYWEWTVLVLAMGFIAFIRFRFLSVPLERDEGEYAYMAQLLLKGIPPYTEAYSMKFPGIYFIYAIILKVFGETHTGIHTALLLVNLVTVILIYFLGRRLLGGWEGVLAAAAFAVSSAMPVVQGFWANSEHFLIFFVMAGLLLLLMSADSLSSFLFFLSGFFLGSAFLVKQHGILFFLFACIFLAYLFFRNHDLPLKVKILKFSLFFLGFLTPVVSAVAYLILKDAFKPFWFWTFIYASRYAVSNPLSEGFHILHENLINIVTPTSILWVTALMELIASWKDKKRASECIFLSGFFLASILTVSVGFYFRPHYFILLLPSLALLAGTGLKTFSMYLSKFRIKTVQTGIPVLLGTALFLQPFITYPAVFFQWTPEKLCKQVYGPNPFIESLVIAHYIQQHTSPGDKVFVFGSEPQIYFYTKRRAATGYLYTYPLTESHPFVSQMQKELILDVEESKPKYLVSVNILGSWYNYANPKLNEWIFNWFSRYSSEYYKQVGFIDLISRSKTEYVWGPEAATYVPQSKYWVAILEKNQGNSAE